MSQGSDWLQSYISDEILKGYRLPLGDPPTFAGCLGDVILPGNQIQEVPLSHSHFQGLNNCSFGMAHCTTLLLVLLGHNSTKMPKPFHEEY